MAIVVMTIPRKWLNRRSVVLRLKHLGDRNGEFDLTLVKKHQTTLTPEIDCRILSLYSHSYKAIKEHIAEICQLEVSEATISSITDELIASL